VWRNEGLASFFGGFRGPRDHPKILHRVLMPLLWIPYALVAQLALIRSVLLGRVLDLAQGGFGRGQGDRALSDLLFEGGDLS